MDASPSEIAVFPPNAGDPPRVHFRLGPQIGTDVWDALVTHPLAILGLSRESLVDEQRRNEGLSKVTPGPLAQAWNPLWELTLLVWEESGKFYLPKPLLCASVPLMYALFIARVALDRPALRVEVQQNTRSWIVEPIAAVVPTGTVRHHLVQLLNEQENPYSAPPTRL